MLLLLLLPPPLLLLFLLLLPVVVAACMTSRPCRADHGVTATKAEATTARHPISSRTTMAMPGLTGRRLRCRVDIWGLWYRGGMPCLSCLLGCC